MKADYTQYLIKSRPKYFWLTVLCFLTQDISVSSRVTERRCCNFSNVAVHSSTSPQRHMHTHTGLLQHLFGRLEKKFTGQWQPSPIIRHNKELYQASFNKSKAGTESKTNLSLGKCNITTGLFVSFTLWEKRQICKFSQKAQVSFSRRIAEVTKELHRNWMGELDQHQRHLNYNTC